MGSFESFKQWLAAMRDCFSGLVLDDLSFMLESGEYTINGTPISNNGPSINPMTIQARGTRVSFKCGPITGWGKVMDHPMLFTTIDVSTASMFRKTTADVSTTVVAPMPVEVAFQSDEAVGDDWTEVDTDGWELV